MLNKRLHYYHQMGKSSIVQLISASSVVKSIPVKLSINPLYKFAPQPKSITLFGL